MLDTVKGKVCAVDTVLIIQVIFNKLLTILTNVTQEDGKTETAAGAAAGAIKHHEISVLPSQG